MKAKVIDTDPVHNSNTNERNESCVMKKTTTCVVNDKGIAVPRFREGSSVVLSNSIKKPGGVAVISNTKDVQCAEVIVPKQTVNQARNLLHPICPGKDGERGFQLATERKSMMFQSTNRCIYLHIPKIVLHLCKV